MKMNILNKSNNILFTAEIDADDNTSKAVKLGLAIKWAIENNYKTYDVGGANPNPISSKEKGIELFKSKWASEEFEYYICTKIFNKTKYNISKLIKNPKGIKDKVSRRTKK